MEPPAEGGSQERKPRTFPTFHVVGRAGLLAWVDIRFLSLAITDFGIDDPFVPAEFPGDGR
jgi:hypothetical protein